jgi:hypothetical protein
MEHCPLVVPYQSFCESYGSVFGIARKGAMNILILSLIWNKYEKGKMFLQRNNGLSNMYRNNNR